MPFKKISGKNNKHQVILFALSTCGWCRMTKELFNSNGIEYEFIDVDLTSGSEREDIIKRVRQLNPRGSFPTIQIDDQVVVGYDEEKIRELLGI